MTDSWHQLWLVSEGTVRQDQRALWLQMGSGCCHAEEATGAGGTGLVQARVRMHALVISGVSLWSKESLCEALRCAHKPFRAAYSTSQRSGSWQGKKMGSRAPEGLWAGGVGSLEAEEERGP